MEIRCLTQGKERILVGRRHRINHLVGNAARCGKFGNGFWQAQTNDGAGIFQSRAIKPMLGKGMVHAVCNRMLAIDQSPITIKYNKSKRVIRHEASSIIILYGRRLVDTAPKIESRRDANQMHFLLCGKHWKPLVNFGSLLNALNARYTVFLAIDSI